MVCQFESRRVNRRLKYNRFDKSQYENYEALNRCVDNIVLEGNEYRLVDCVSSTILERIHELLTVGKYIFTLTEKQALSDIMVRSDRYKIQPDLDVR